MKRYKDYMLIKYGPIKTYHHWLRFSRRHISPRTLRPVMQWKLPHYPGEGRRYRCDTPSCRRVGWGPMLRDIVWDRHFAKNTLLCELCMRRRLGRPLGPRDLRDCPMNEQYVYYRSHGVRG
jgi:hypothetical protein